MIPAPDWGDPVAVRHYKRKIMRRHLLQLVGAVLLPAAAVMIKLAALAAMAMLMLQT